MKLLNLAKSRLQENRNIDLKTQKDYVQKERNNLLFRFTDWPKIGEPKLQHRIQVDNFKNLTLKYTIYIHTYITSICEGLKNSYWVREIAD